jgi:hypothetical protein
MFRSGSGAATDFQPPVSVCRTGILGLSYCVLIAARISVTARSRPVKTARAMML